MGQTHMRTLTATALCVPFLLLPAGCAHNPFLPNDDDYARRVAMERLRALPPANMDQYRSPVSVDTSKLNTVLDSVREARERFEAMEKFDLALEQCRQSTIENNLDLKTALIEPALAAERVREEDAKFNAAFTLQANYTDAEFPTASRLNSSAFKQFQVQPGVRIPTRTGGNVVVDFVGNRQETNNEFSLLNPSYETDLRFTLSHSLLRNAGRRVSTAQIVIAGYNEQASEARTKLEAMQQVTNADRSYWRLYQSRASLDVRLQQFDVAKSQIDRAERRVRDGVAADIEVDRAKAGAAQRLEAIVLAQNDVLLRQRELKRVMHQPGLDIDTKVMVVPSSPPDPVQYVFDVQSLQQLALANRMELLELEVQLASDAVTIGVERNRTLPLVDMQFSYRLNGLGDNIGKSLETTAEYQNPDWTIGLNAEMPLNNEEARSRVRRALLTRMQRFATKESREQSIRSEVLNAADSLELGWQRILAARQAVISATRALESEQRQFDLGRSTSNDVLNSASNLGDAQIAEVQALTDYQLAQIDLAFATGTLLGAAKVEVEPAQRINLNDYPESADPQPSEPNK